MTPYNTMENKHEQTWKLLVETARAKHRHTVIMETALQEELKRKKCLEQMFFM